MAKNEYKRAFARNILVELGIDNMGTGNGATAKLPQGAMLMDCGLITETAFNSVTTATGTLSDGTTTFVNAVDVKSTGKETSAGAPKYYPAGGTLTWSLAQTGGDATAGRAFGYATYLINGVGDEPYG